MSYPDCRCGILPKGPATVLHQYPRPDLPLSPPRSEAGRTAPVKIERIEAIPYAIPYMHPLKFASGEVSTADHVLVRVYTDEGVVGVADAPPRPYTYGETQESIRAIIDNVFAPQLLGIEVLDREQIHAVLGRTVNNHVAKGPLTSPSGTQSARRSEHRYTSCSAGTPTACGSATCSASARRKNCSMRHCASARSTASPPSSSR